MFMSRKKRQREGRTVGRERGPKGMEGKGGGENGGQGRAERDGEENRRNRCMFCPTELRACYLAPLQLAFFRLGAQIPSAMGRHSWPLLTFIRAIHPSIQSPLSSVLRHVLGVGSRAGRSRDKKILLPHSE